jgi:glycosyltransferase involved in cell wall biosynthesis
MPRLKAILGRQYVPERFPVREQKNWFKLLAKRLVNRAAGSVWMARKRLGLQEDPGELPKFSAVILSYKRMENVQRIVDALLACDFLDEVVVSNNNPEVRMADHLRIRSPRVRVIDQPTRCFASIRFELALGLKCDHFLFIDDDIFLSPSQITRLALRCVADGQRVHGISGHAYHYEAVEGQFVEGEHAHGTDQEVDVLHEVYAVRRPHLITYFELLRASGLPDDQSRICDDIFLSFSGEARPAVHDVGRVLKCESWDDPAVALHQLDRFHHTRQAVFTSLAKVKQTQCAHRSQRASGTVTA